MIMNRYRSRALNCNANDTGMKNQQDILLFHACSFEFEPENCWTPLGRCCSSVSFSSPATTHYAPQHNFTECRFGNSFDDLISALIYKSIDITKRIPNCKLSAEIARRAAGWVAATAALCGTCTGISTYPLPAADEELDTLSTL